MSKIRIGIIGCGAVTEQMYVPAITALASAEISTLVDTNIARAEKLAAGIKDVYISKNYQEVFDKVDAVIIALPHMLHAPVAIDYIKKGIHVLVEKPMAMNVRECDHMIIAATENHCILAVGLIRRFYSSYSLVKKIIDEGWLGQIHSFDFREGFIYNWPAVSDFFFKKETGGGVLADTGAHTLDTLLWWLGDYHSFEYYDDAMGGVEADCMVHLQLKNGAKGIVELSRTRKLRNTYQIEGEKASLEVGTNFNSNIYVRLNGHKDFEGRFTQTQVSQKYFLDIARRQIENFINSIRGQQMPFIPGNEGRRAIVLIEECYKRRFVLEQQWARPQI